MDTNNKKAFVKFLISAINNTDSNPFPIPDDQDGDGCVVTNMFFPDNLSESQITITGEGPVWLGLWLGEEIKFDEGGLALFPTWLAEAIREESGMSIHEDCIEKD